VIASLSGTVQAKGPGFCVLEVGGVGYQVLVPFALAEKCLVGDPLFLNTVLIVREDGFTLFGFSDIEQLRLFDHLRSVSGVGPKTALGVISNLSAGEIANAVADDDPSAFQRVPGVGAKTAKLIVVTLSGKLQSLETSRSADSNELMLAMQSLGWPERLAESAVREVLKNRADKSLADLIRETLVALGAKK
jgi:Holliday junction DNA helicase RuvA